MANQYVAKPEREKLRDAALFRLGQLLEAGIERAELFADPEVARAVHIPEEVRRDAKLRAHGHKQGCECKMCQAIKRNVARGIERAEQARAQGKVCIKREASSKLKREAFKANLTNPDSPTFANPQKSAEALGYSDTQAARLAKTWIQDARTRILAADLEVGIDDRFLAAKRRELLEANKTEFFSHKGEVLDEREVADNSTRVRALELTHKVRGEMPKEEADVQAALILQVGDRPVEDADWEGLVAVELERTERQGGQGGAIPHTLNAAPIINKDTKT